MARKKEISNETMAEAITKNFYKISADSPAYILVHGVVSSLLDETGKRLDDYMRDQWNRGISREVLVHQAQALRFDDTEIFIGSISSYGDGGNPFENFLCDNTVIDYDGGDFYVFKDNRY